MPWVKTENFSLNPTALGFGCQQTAHLMPPPPPWSRNGGLRNGPGWRVAAAEPRAAPAADEGRFFGVSGS